MRIECHGCKVQYEVDDDTDLMVMQCPNCQCRNGWRVVDLIACSECQNAIAKDAPLCPHCGRQVRPLLTSPDVKRISTGWVLACAAAFALIHIALVWVVIDQTVGKIGRAMTPQRQTFHTAAKRTQEEIMQKAARGLQSLGRFSEVVARGNVIYARAADNARDLSAAAWLGGYVRSASENLDLAGYPSQVVGAIIPPGETIPPKTAYYQVIADRGVITKRSDDKK